MRTDARRSPVATEKVVRAAQMDRPRLALFPMFSVMIHLTLPIEESSERSGCSRHESNRRMQVASSCLQLVSESSCLQL